MSRRDRPNPVSAITFFNKDTLKFMQGFTQNHTNGIAYGQFFSHSNAENTI